MDIVKQLRHVTGRPKECTPKITSEAADEIERLRDAIREARVDAIREAHVKVSDAYYYEACALLAAAHQQE